MKKALIMIFSAILAILCLFGCENNGSSASESSNVSSSPFEEATSLEGGFEMPIMPND